MSVYRLQSGHVSAATLVANAANIVSSFPNTTAPYKDWRVNTDGIISTYVQRITTPTAKDYGYGMPTTQWAFNINRTQVEYLIDTFFAGALTAPVTLMTWRFNNQSASGIARNWVILQATARLTFGQTIENTVNLNDTWATNCLITFVRGTYLAVP